MKPSILACLLGFALLAQAPSACSQQMYGAVEGRLRDWSGSPLPDAAISISGPALQGTRGTLSDREGHYLLQSLPVGIYNIRISHVAHTKTLLDGIVVELGATTDLGELRLERSVSEMPPVVVASTPRRIDTSSTVIRTRFTQRDIESLPADRNFQSLAGIAPDASIMALGAGPGFAGSTGEGNYYYIDGTDATDPAGAGSSINLPHDFIRSIEVRSGALDAEDGRALGGIINVVTSSGGDEVHGRVFGYYTSQAFVKRSNSSLFQAPAGDFREFDLGGDVGGPILRQKLWWFAAYNPAKETRTIPVPGLSDQGVTATSHRLAGKITWRASAATQLNLTLLGDPSRSRVVGAPFGIGGQPSLVLNEDAVVATTRSGSVNVSLHGQHQLLPTVLLQAAVSRVHNESYVNPISDRGRTEPFFIDQETGTASGGYGGENKNSSDRTAARIGGTVSWGKHTLKAGAEYVDNSFTSDTQFGAGKEHAGFLFRADNTTYVWYQGFNVGSVHAKTPSVFIKDSWRVTERLRANAGIRWDAVSYTDWRGGTALQVTDQFSPRLGLIYSPGGHDAQKISAYFGRIHEQVPAGSPGYYFSDSKQLSIGFDHDPRVDPSGGDSTALIPSPPGVSSLEGQYSDEWALGYERALPGQLVGIVRARYRSVKQVIEDAYSPTENRFLIGNPGQGALSYLPEASQAYKAIELTIERSGGADGLDFLASYVLSRSEGNYAGLILGNGGPQFDFVETTVNSDGRLPNDRPHAFKLSGSYRSGFGAGLGATFLWQSGSPVNELGALAGTPYTVYLRPRGSGGRTPSTWDLNIRMSYRPLSKGRGLNPELVLDLFHPFSQHRALALDEQHFFAVDAGGNPTSANPNYLRPTVYQPAFSSRLGLVIAF
jgi:hypothetical protein